MPSRMPHVKTKGVKHMSNHNIYIHKYIIQSHEQEGRQWNVMGQKNWDRRKYVSATRGR